MADERFQNLITALCMLAARPDDLNDRADAAILEIKDYLARSDQEGERVCVAVRAEAEMAEQQRPNEVPFWITVQAFLGSLKAPEP